MQPALDFKPAIEVVPAISAQVLAELRGDRLPLLIDLRSEGEFAQDHLPLAHNLALFDDDERALVGHLYVRHSPEEALREGRAIVLAKIDDLVARIGALAGWEGGDESSRERVRAWTAGGIVHLERELGIVEIDALREGAVVLCCQRGGMRSRAVAALLRSLGHAQVVIVAGGYRAWRRALLASLETWRAPPAYVLRGLTGVGKTLVLRAIERLRPHATIDLEAAAGHRSSLLGMVGLEPCSQKVFEGRLHARTRRPFGSAVVLEGESRKVGDAIIPRTLWSALDGGTDIELHASRERRVQVLMQDYLASPTSRPRLRAQLAEVARRMRPRCPLVELFDGGRERELVLLLLEHYYDPLYRHSERGRAHALSVDASDPVRAADEIVSWIEERAGPLEPA